MRLKMSDNQKTESAPDAYIVSTEGVEIKSKNSRVSKKSVAIAISCVVVAVLVLGAVLGGIHIVTESQKEIIKYQINYTDSNHNEAQQDVSSSKDDNTVQYHVVKNGQETWIIDDFNSDLQIVKVATGNGVSCFVTLLNETNSQNPATINGPQTTNGPTKSNSLIYIASDNAIPDTAFLGPKVNALCNNIPIYWLSPRCVGDSQPPANLTSAVADPGRKKRDGWFDSPQVGWLNLASGGRLPCYGGCCWWLCTSCLKSTVIYDVKVGNYISCTWIFTSSSCAWAAYLMNGQYCTLWV